MDFIPYGKQDIEQEDIEQVIETLQSNYLTTGPKVLEFEQALADYCQAKYCVAVSNGTAALHLLSLCLLIKDDLVLTSPNSFLATANSILYVRAKPIFVDINPQGNIDLDLCEQELKKNPKIKALYAIAFSGQMIEQKKLQNLKENYNITIIEDCAHAIGAKDNNVKAGSCKNSNASILSFHPVKHMTTGEGGAITTNSKELYKKLLLLRNHGMIREQKTMKPWEYEMHELGYNYRITDIQCALGISQLKKLNKFIKKRIKLAQNYDQAFSSHPIIKPLYQYNGKSSYHLYVILVDFSKISISREELFIQARKKNIGLQVHYIPINKQPYYKKLGYGNEDTPNMERYYQQCFSIPLYPKLTEQKQEFVIKTLKSLLR